MKKTLFIIFMASFVFGCAGGFELSKTAAPPVAPDTKKVKVDQSATERFLYNGGSGGAVTAGTNVTITDNGDSIAINASLSGGAVDTSGTPVADDIAQFIDADTIKGMTYAELAAIAGYESALEAVLDLSDLQDAVTDAQVPNDITIDLATLATTLTITDNESTAETNAILFTAGGDLDGGNLGIESDGDLTYNPSTGTLAATVLSDGTISISSGSITGLVEGGLPNSSIVTADIKDGEITEADLKVVDSPSDEDIFTYESTTGDFEWHSLAETKAAMSLDAVENTALSTWAGSANITTLGTIGTGTWQGDAIGTTYAGTDLSAANLSSALTFAEGDLIDLSGITMSAATDEGLALPTYADVAPATEKYYAAYDAANNRIMVRESGGWVDTSAGSGAATSLNFVVTSAEGSLSDESVLTAGNAIDITDAGGDGGAVTVAFDPTEVSADGSDTWSDGSQASIVWTFDLSGTDHTMTASSGIMTFGDAVTVTDTLTASAGINLGTSQSVVATTGMTIGGGTETVAINSSDWDIDATGVVTGIGNITSDGVVTATGFTIGSAAILEAELEILDGATLGTADINIIDGISDLGSLTAAELLYVDGVTSAIQAQLDARCLESVFGTALEADDLALNGTTLELVAEIPHSDAVLNISADWETQDDVAESIGNDNDWERTYDETTDDRLEYVHSAGAGADVYWDLNDNAADSTYTITNSDGTYEANLSVEGDVTTGGTLTVGGDGDSYITFSNNTSYAGSGYQLFFEGGNLIAVEGGAEKTVLNATDGATLTGTSWDFGGVTNFEIPNGNSATADAEGEIAIDTDDEQFIMYVGGSAITMDFTGDTNGYVLKSNGSGVLTLQADATGGSPTIDSVGDATGDATIAFDAGEEMSWQYTGNYTTGTQFLVQQQTGNPTGGVLFEARGADSDSTVAKFGDGTNAWTVSTAGLLTNAGTATLNFAAASDLTVGGSQIDHDDMAGAAVVASTGGLNIDEDVDIDFDAADEEMSIVNSAEYGADGAQVTIENTDADVGAAMYLLRLRYTDDGQANADFAVFEDNNGDDMIAFTDGGSITAAGTIEGATLTEGGNAVYNSTETPGGELGGTWASPTVDDVGVTLTSITIGALLGVDSIDATGAVDMDYGSVDVTDHTFISDGGTTVIDGLINIPASTSYQVAGTAILSDSAGTMTLSNVDALDATTETTIEAAIDTLGSLGAGGLADDTVLFADLDDDGNYGPFTGTWDFTGGTLVADGIDGSGAVDFDIGSVDITDVTIITDGGSVVIDGSTITAAAADDPYVVFDPSTASESEWWIGVNHDSVGDDNDSMEIRQSATPGTNVEFEIEPDADIIIGSGADADTTITIDNDDTDGVIQRMADEKTWKFNNILAVTPQTYDATDAADTDIALGTEITSSIVYVTGDNDSDGDEVDLQDGNVDGQIVRFIASTGIDSDDVITVDTTTDSTCTGCTAVSLDEPGDSFECSWHTTIGWNCYQLNEAP